jgi:hypothetical protein
MGEATRVPGSVGDLWSSAWAADDTLFVMSDDTTGFDESCDSNVALHRLTGDQTTLRGETVNPLEAYGGHDELGPDGASWKGCGLASIDGSLYMSLSRHRYGEVTSFFIQQAWDASIVRSDDGGRTWSTQPPLGGAMFPGQTFATPFFVDYGRDGGALPDEAVDFVYAVSSLGVWNNGSSLALGRVPRTRIGRLAAVDWEFVQGFRDGKPVWSTNHHAAAYVHRDPGRLSMNGMAYIAGLGGYLLPQWHYIYSDETLRLTKWLQFLEHTPTRLSFSFSEHPWGPWRPIGEHVSALEGWYNPAVVSKFSSADGLNLSLFVSGLARSRDSYPEGIEYYPTLSERYSLNVLPLELSLDAEENRSA